MVGGTDSCILAFGVQNENYGLVMPVGRQFQQATKERSSVCPRAALASFIMPR